MTDTKTMLELKTCPFCGTPATVNYDSGITQIECANDEHCLVTVDIQHRNEAIAIEAWNTRAAAPSVPAEMADTKTMLELADKWRKEAVRHQAPAAEPVAWRWKPKSWGDDWALSFHKPDHETTEPLYAFPPAAQTMREALQKALVAMTLASGFETINAEYDFSHAIDDARAALAPSAGADK